MIDGSPPLHVKFLWLFCDSSWLSNTHSTVSTFSSMCTASAAAWTPVDCSELHLSPAACWCCSSSKLCYKLCYKLPSIVTFTFIQIFDRTESKLLDTASKFALFLVSGVKDEKLIKSKPTWKLKHANSILEPYEYFCQISSKLIIIISSYTISKLRRFLRHSVYRVHW